MAYRLGLTDLLICILHSVPDSLRYPMHFRPFLLKIGVIDILRDPSAYYDIG